MTRLAPVAAAAALLSLIAGPLAWAQDDDGAMGNTYPTAQPAEGPATPELPLVSDQAGQPVLAAAPANRTAAAAAVPAAATGAPALGASVERLPAGCVSTPAAGAFYFRCGDVWYQPHYEAAGVRYVVVKAP